LAPSCQQRPTNGLHWQFGTIPYHSQYIRHAYAREQADCWQLKDAEDVRSGLKKDRDLAIYKVLYPRAFNIDTGAI